MSRNKKIDGKAELNLEGGPLPEGHPLRGSQVWVGSSFPEGWRKQLVEKKRRSRQDQAALPAEEPKVPDGPFVPEEARGLFCEAEYRILAHYFGHYPEYRQLADDLEKVQESSPWNSLDGAVAQIVLEHIQERLPNWMTKDEHGDWVQTRKIAKTRSQRKVLLRPIFVGAREGFGSGPGCGWFCHYYATWVPLFDRFVVTESGDGGEDRAMGDFDASRGFDNEALNEIFDGDWISDDEWVRGPGFGLKPRGL